MNETLILALDSLVKNKLRSLLTVLEIVIGVTTVIGMSSIINGLISGVDQIPPQYRSVGKVLGASRIQMALQIVLPAALPGLGGSAFQLDWTLSAGAKGYRVYKISSTGRRTLISTLGPTAKTLTVTGVPTNTRFMVEAFAGTQIAARAKSAATVRRATRARRRPASSCSTR